MDNDFREQPQEVEAIFDDDIPEIADVEGSLAGQLQDEKSEDRSEAERGVPVGKFKSVDDLLDAYNNLQAEFTRKCQKLSAFEKKAKVETPDAIPEKNNNNVDVANTMSEAVFNDLEVLKNHSNESGVFQNTSTEASVDENMKSFLSKNPDAFSYLDEIKAEVENDETLKTESDAFEKAWAKILWKKLSSTSLSKEPLVKNLILKDNELKNLIIEDYVKQLQEQHIPVIMSSSGERVTKVVTPKPDSFESAKKVVLDLFS